jgi:hypothetical protein
LFFSGSESDNYLEMEGVGELYGVVEKERGASEEE